MIKTVYFDMDGVLADWEHGFGKLFNDITVKEYDSLPDEIKLERKLKIARHPNFYLNLPRIENGFKWVESFRNEFENIEILTSCGKYETESVVAQKREWLKNHGLGDLKFNYTVSSIEKGEFAKPDSLLIDDREKSVNAFTASGGKAILFFE